MEQGPGSYAWEGESWDVARKKKRTLQSRATAWFLSEQRRGRDKDTHAGSETKIPEGGVGFFSSLERMRTIQKKISREEDTHIERRYLEKDFPILIFSSFFLREYWY
jgi:hypothetical protein